MLLDKDIDGVIKLLMPYINAWYLADIHHPRGAKAFQIKQKLGGKQNSKEFFHVSEALNAACKEANKNDRIIVFGSFYTVASAIVAVTENRNYKTI
jgi:dihydrofolate synthase/folylpolyglutamate synthase